jgi:hypothetical protein
VEVEIDMKGGKMMKRTLIRILTFTMSVVIAGIFTTIAIASEDAPRITKEELKKLLDNPGVLIIDVRIGKDWDASEFKIKGAVRRNPFSWSAPDFPKDKTIVFYCA